MGTGRSSETTPQCIHAVPSRLEDGDYGGQAIANSLGGVDLRICALELANIIREIKV